MKIPELRRIAGNRLIIAVQILATSQAPPSTLIGSMSELPPHPTKEDLEKQYAQPFSLDGAVMTDEKTQQKFAMLPTDPHGPHYLPSVTLSWLEPGKSDYLTIQFPIPPPPAPDSSAKIPTQTVSILLPRATGPITGVVVPPPDAVKAPGP